MMLTASVAWSYPGVGESAPNVRYQDLDGNDHYLYDQFPDQIIVLELFSIGCHYCRDTLAQYNTYIWEYFQARGDPVVVFPVEMWTSYYSRDDVKNWKNGQGYTMPFGYDAYGELRQYYNDGSGSVPRSYAIDCDFVIQWVHGGACYSGCAQSLRDFIEDTLLPGCNQPPELSNPTHSPAYGRTDWDFTFTVDYYDPDGDAPSVIQVFVNGTAHDMALDSGTADNGTYLWTGGIDDPGLSQYHFECNDGRGGSARLPETGELDGPYVYDDYEAPVSSCSGPSRTRVDAVTIDYAASDNDSGVYVVRLYYQYNGGGYIDSGHASSNPSGSFEVTLAAGNGVYDFYTIAEDLVGNVEDAPASPDLTIVFDNIPPTSSASAEQYWTATPILVDFVASDELSGVKTTSLWYRFNGGAWTDSGLSSGGEAGTFSFAAPQGEGTYELCTVCTDNNDNVEAGPTAPDCTVVYDATKPQSSCICVEQTNSSTISVDYTASDNQGIAEVALWYRKDSGSWADTGKRKSGASGSFSFVFAEGDGVYEFYTVATDLAGNVEGAPGAADTSVYYDSTMPQSNCWADDYANTVPFSVWFSASDSGTGVAQTRLYYRFAGEAEWVDSWLVETGVSGVFSLNPFAVTPQFGDGEYELMTISTDNVGNDEAPPALPDDTIILDTTPPDSSVTCSEWSSTSPLVVDFVASDALTGVSSVSLWYRFDGGEWMDTGLSQAGESGSFVFPFSHGQGLYEFMSKASDVAGNVESPDAADASCIYDTEPPVTGASADEVVNDPTIVVAFSSQDNLTGIASVHLYYRYTSLDGVPDETLRDTGLEVSAATGSFEWAPDMGPGFYRFFVAATDVAGNVEPVGEQADAVSLFDPRLALSQANAPLYTTVSTIAVTFTTDIGTDGYSGVTLYYRYGTSLSEAEAASWITTSTTSPETSGTLSFFCLNGDGCYQFFTRASSSTGLLEPVATRPDATTIADSLPPQSSVEAPPISATGVFSVTFSTIEPYGLASLELFWWYQGSWALWTTVDEMNGSVVFDAGGNEGEYRFYSIGTDLAGNVEQPPASGYDCSVLVDLSPPVSSAQVSDYQSSLPISVEFIAQDTVTNVVSVSLWARCEGGDWEDTGLSGSGNSGTLSYTPAPAVEGTYYFYTVAEDSAGHIEAAPATWDDKVVVDWTAPQTSCSAVGYTSVATIAITYTGSDALSGIESVSVWVMPEASGWVDSGRAATGDAGQIEVNVAGWGEGTFGFCTRALDKAGNLEALPGTPPVTTVYDATPPTSSALIPPEGLYANSSPIDVAYTASDGASGIKRVALWFRFEGGQWEDSGLVETSAEGSFSFVPPYGDGRYEFATVAFDLAGNPEPLPQTPDGGTLVFDTVAPQSSVSFPGQYIGELPIGLSFNAADLTSGISEIRVFVSFNGSAFEDTGLSLTGTSGTVQYTPATAAEGIYEFYSIATDKAGNVELAPDTPDVTVILDTTAPVSEASVPSQYTNQFPISVMYSANDTTSGLSLVKLYASIDDGPWEYTGLSSTEPAGTFDYTPSTQADGSYSFYTVATDLAGNVEAAPAQADASIVVDTTRPTSQCSIEATLTNAFPISIDYSSSDSGSGVSCVKLFWRLDNSAWAEAATLPAASGTYQFTPASPVDGYYEFYTEALDLASNVETTSGADDGIRVDRTPPESSATSPASVTRAPFMVQFSAGDAGSGVSTTELWYRFDGGSWVDSGLSRTGTVGYFEFAAPEGEGTYDFYTVCTDNAGNVEAAPEAPDATTVFRTPKPDISVSDESIDFGQVNVGEQASETLTVTNIGDGDLSINDISVTDGVFEAVAQASLPATLAPDETLRITVNFAPDQAASFEGELVISSNDPDTPELTVGLAGEGVVTGGVSVDVSTNSEEYQFGDTLQIEISCENTGLPVTVDVYLLLTFDLGGPDERVWSATTQGWTEELIPLAASLGLETGFEYSGLFWESELPCQLPLISRSGRYTLQMAAVEPGTQGLVSNLAESQFTVAGQPFVDILTDEAAYSIAGDTIAVSLAIDLPSYSMTADFYAVLMGPDGALWTPSGFGTDVLWQPGVSALLVNIQTTPSWQTQAVFWEVNLPAQAPFDAQGQFVLFSALVQPGTLTPLSDIGTTTFSLQ